MASLTTMIAGICLSSFSYAGASYRKVAKEDCLNGGGKARGRADGIQLVCEGGKYNRYTIGGSDYAVSLDSVAAVGRGRSDRLLAEKRHCDGIAKEKTKQQGKL
ncbi:hypothetical protein [Bdellovibrio sp. HCB337]|uniref:hypothetical protein n=1 Tax=Bdellovibrio sp. HCB337 TaxID=3394358 RepID=UPI0039A75A1A